MLSRRWPYERANSEAQSQGSHYELRQMTPVPGDDRYLGHHSKQDSTQATGDSPSVVHNSMVENVPAAKMLWVPFELRSRSLAIFLISFPALIFALAAIFAYAKAHQGLTGAYEKDYYLWTYGPTAVFTIIAALWSQVDYKAKLIAPWVTLRQGHRNANKHLLLDYISPIAPVTFFASIRHSHYVVTGAIIGSSLLQIAIVLSTNLFRLDAVLVSQPQTFNVTRHFDPQAGLMQLQVDSSNLTAFKAATNNPAAIFLRTEELDSPFPYGTTALFAFQPFHIPPGYSGNLTASVQGFSAELTCQPGKLDLASNFTCVEQVIVCPDGSCESFDFVPHNIHVSSADCDIVGLIQPEACVYVQDPDETTNAAAIPNSGAYGFALSSRCGNSSEGDDYRIAISNLVFSEGLVVQSTSIVCKPSWLLREVSINIPSIQGVPQSTVTVNSLDRALVDTPNLSAMDLVQGVINCTSNAIGADSYWEIMLGTTALNTTALMDSNVLMNATEKVFSAVAAQIASQYLTASNPSSSIISGSATSLEQRVIVSNTTFGLTAAVMIILSIISGVLFLLAPRMASVSRDPGSIGGLAAILASSMPFLDRLDGLGASSANKLTSSLAPLYVQSQLQPGTGPQGRSFSIIANDDIRGTVPSMSLEVTNSAPWWRPFSVSRSMYVVAALLPVVYIAILEGLYQYSEKHDGIATVSSSKVESYAWSFVPALFMLALRLCLESLHQGALIFYPFSLLRSGASNAIVILSNPAGTLSIVNFWTSLRDRQMILLVLSAALMVAPGLSIAVAGLYSVVPVNILSDGAVYRLDNFTIALPPNTTTVDGDVVVGNAASVYSLSLILNQGVQFPQFTWNEFTFPTFAIDPLSLAQDFSVYQAQKVSVRVPAARGNQNCSIVEPVRIGAFTEWFSDAVGDGGEGYPITIPPLGGCPTTACSIGMFESRNILCSVSNTTGDWTFLPGYGYSGNFGSWVSPSNGLGVLQGTAPTACPESLMWIGRVDSNGMSNVTILQCDPYVEELDVDVTFHLPNFTLSLDEPPQPVESSVRILSRHPPSSDDGDDIAWQAVPAGADAISMSPTKNGAWDFFFDHLILGRYGVNASSLIGPSNVENLIARANKLYGLWIAQEINFLSRTTLPTISRPTYPATYTISQQRLVQSAISTRILEGLLAALWLFAVATMLLVKTQRVLPHNPCTIAGTASMLAGADMLSLIPPGSEWCGDKELRRRGVFEGYLYSLGWWRSEVEGLGARWGIDVGVAERAD